MADTETNLFVQEVKVEKAQTYFIAVDRKPDGKLSLMIDQSTSGGPVKIIEVSEETFTRFYRALRAARKVMVSEMKSKSPTTTPPPRSPTHHPHMAGKTWTQADDDYLSALYNQGDSIGQLTNRFQRTRAAIVSRLKKLGLIPRA